VDEVGGREGSCFCRESGHGLELRAMTLVDLGGGSMSDGDGSNPE